MSTKQSADMTREKKVKYLAGSLQQKLQTIYSSAILTEQYPVSTIVFNFTIIEMDADLLQQMVNCATIALYSSKFACRCLPIAICSLIKADHK